MTTERVTVGDLDPGRELYYYSTSTRALFDDTPICKNCLGEEYRGRNGGPQPLLPTTTEVPEV